MGSDLTYGSSALAPASAGTSPRLVTLAILKANWNNGRSYLDNFVPFVVECLRDSNGPMSVKATQAALLTRFGIEIPQGALTTVLGRAVKTGQAERNERAYSLKPEARGVRPHPAAQQELLRCYEALVEQFQSFASRRFNLELSAARSGAALNDYVADYGASIVLRGAAAEREFHPSVAAEPATDYIVHAFVEHTATADPATFDYLEKVVEGSMLASVLYLPDTSTVQRKFRDSTIYLDTPFLLDALGYNGDQVASAATELLRLLREYGARVACFQKTLSELRGVLWAAATKLGAGGGGGRDGADIVTTLVQRKARKADVELEIGELETTLRRLGVVVLDAPAYTRHLGVDEAEFAEVLGTEVRYYNENAKRHDLDALTAIHRLRGGATQPILEDCKAIFLTTNDALVRASRKFFRVDHRDQSWPHAILDTDLATLVWLKSPMKAPDLPRKQIMADCYATLRPDKDLWGAWLEEIERLESAGTYTDEQLDVMRYSVDAQRALMDSTLGDPSAIRDSTVEDVLAAAEARIVGPVRDELAVERERREAAEAKAQQHERELAESEAVRDATLSEATLRRENLESQAQRSARRVGRAVFWGLLALAGVGAVLALLGSSFPGPGLAWPLRALAGLASAVTLLTTVAAAGWSTDLRAVAGRVERSVEPHLLRRRLRRAGYLP